MSSGTTLTQEMIQLLASDRIPTHLSTDMKHWEHYFILEPDSAVCRLMPMTHSDETETINPLHISDAGFCYVSDANLVLVLSGIRFRRRSESYSVPTQKPAST